MPTGASWPHTARILLLGEVRASCVCGAPQVSVRGMIELRDAAAFKNHLRDLLVQTKAFASEADADLFANDAARTAEQARLAAIPGMLQPGRTTEEVMGE